MKKLTAEELNRLSVDEFQEAKKHPVVIVMDNVRSLNNVGSAFRSCDAFAAEGLYLCGITGKPPHRDIRKTAIGAEDSVSWKHFPKTEEALQALKEEGYQIYALEQTDKSTSLLEFSPKADEKYAFVMGNEVFGVSDEALALCDGYLEIPQFGTKHSLNVSVTAGVVLWHYIQGILK